LLTLVYMAFAGLGALYVLLAAFLGHGADAGGGGGGHGAAFGGHHAGGGAHSAHGDAAAGGHGAPATHAHPHPEDTTTGGRHSEAAEAAEAGAPYGLDGGGHGAVAATAQTVAAFHFPFFSPLALATLVAAIGGWGLIAKYALDAGDAASLAMAIPAAMATAYFVTWAGWRIVSGARANSVIRLQDLVGRIAEVTIPIPAGGVGEASVLVDGERYAAPAREAAGGAVARGAAVTIVAAGPTLLVRAGQAPANQEEGASHG
jgi:hypothetical protein